MTDLQVDGWMRWNGFYHSANVYRCRGLSEPAAERQVAEDLGPAFERRRAAMAAALKAKYGSEYHETNEFLAFGHVLTPTYCRRIRYVVSDMRRAAAELARRLKVD
jgi:hypothetical protein